MAAARLVWLLVLCLGCRPTAAPESSAVDRDGDGYLAREDCDDADGAVHPGATERCDGLDDDCDGAVDTDDPDLVDGVSSWPDFDRDGYGDVAVAVEISCRAPAGASTDGTDCDDHDAEVHPAAPESCDGVDDDCDGAVDAADDDLVDGLVLYPDDDGDGFGAAGAGQVACTVWPGWTEVGGDCDDADRTLSPDAREVCDAVDNDCDGYVDQPGAPAEPLWHPDRDGDGYGAIVPSAHACEAPSG